ncbi:MAG: DMT family transporter [Gaiellales bacterium]
MIAVPATLHRTRGAMVGLLVGIALFSIQDPIIKGVSDAYPVAETIAFRAVFALPIFTLLVVNAGGLGLVRRHRPGALIGRGLLMLTAYASFYLALAELSLATTVALWFTAPLFMVALSGLIAGEHPGWRSWAAVLVGFGGVLVIAHPSNETSWAIALPVVAAAFYATGQLVARRVGGGIPSPVIAWQQNAVYLVGALAISALLAPLAQTGSDTGSLAFLLRPWAVPTTGDFLLLALCGPIAGIGSTLIVHAYRTCGPGRIGVLEYSALLWAALWGFVVFGDVPTAWTVVGALLIVASGAYAVLRAASGAAPAPDRR